MRCAHLAASVLVALFACLGQNGAAASASVPQGRTSPASENLERWNKLTDAERAELRKRFEKLESMTAEERSRVKRRAEGIRRETEQLLGSLEEKERAAIQSLEPKERKRVLRSLLVDRARLAGKRLRDRMTGDERKGFEAADPRERDRILEAVRKRELRRLPERIAALGTELGMSHSDLRRIQGSDSAAKRRHIAEFVRRRAKKVVESEGLPEGFDEARWSRIMRMDDEGFLRAMRRARTRHPELGIPKARWEAKLKRNGTLADRLERLALPSLEARAQAPGASEKRLVREAILANRRRIEDTMVRQLRLRVGQAARLRAKGDDGFLAAYHFVIRTLRGGGQVDAAFDRWFDRQDAAPKGERRGERQGKRNK